MSALARAYVRWQRWRRRAHAAWDAAQTGFWLGVLAPGDLHAVDGLFYDANPTYRDDRHNGRGLFPWEAEALRDHFGGCRSLVVIGAGGGREVLALSGMGLEVAGYECNPALVEYAGGLLARRGCAAPVRLLPRDRAPAEGGPYDGAVVGWSAYTLMAGHERRVAFLRELRPRVRTGGPVLLSFFTRGEAEVRPRIVARVASALRRPLRRPPAEPGDDLGPNYIHRFVGSEIAGELRAAGFHPVRFQPQGPGPYDSGWAVGRAV